MIATIGTEGKLAVNLDMCFIIVPSNQKKVTVEVTGYPAESDKGPCPVRD